MTYNSNSEIFAQFDKLRQQIMMSVSLLCSEWGVTVRAYYDVVEKVFDTFACQVQAELHALAIGNWLQLSGNEIRAYKEIATELENADAGKTIITSIILELMRSLIEKTKTSPYDDLKLKKPYFIMSTSLLRYYLRNNSLSYGIQGDLYGKLAVNMAKNIGLTGTLGNVQSVYDLPIWNLLLYGLDHVNKYGLIAAKIRIQLGLLLIKVCLYEDAGKYIEEARKAAIRDGKSSTLVDVYTAQSTLTECQGLYAEAFKYAWLAYKINEELFGAECEENIPVILKICELCLYVEDKESCKLWFNKVNTEMIPMHSESFIKIQLIQAEVCDDILISCHLCEQAEIICYRLYGYLHDDIPFTRSRIFFDCAMFDEGVEATSEQIKTSQFLFGMAGLGDISCYYTYQIISKLASGASATAVTLSQFIIDYCPADHPVFSFFVRAFHWLSIAYCYLYAPTSSNDRSLASNYADAVLEEVEKIKPSDDTINFIEPMFSSKIPANIFYSDLTKLSMQIKIEVAIEEGDLDDAEELCKICLRDVKGDDILSMQALVGKVYAKQGRLEKAIDVWKETLRNAGDDVMMEIAADIAESAKDVYLTDFALETIDHAQTRSVNSIYTHYLTFAEIFNSVCLFDKRDEMYIMAYRAAISQKQKARILYAQAMEEDFGATERLEEAIALSKPDQALCTDEELSIFYCQLAEKKQAHCQLAEARQAVAEAKRLAAVDCPEYFDDINDII